MAFCVSVGALIQAFSPLNKKHWPSVVCVADIKQTVVWACIGHGREESVLKRFLSFSDILVFGLHNQKVNVWRCFSCSGLSDRGCFAVVI